MRHLFLAALTFFHLLLNYFALDPPTFVIIKKPTTKLKKNPLKRISIENVWCLNIDFILPTNLQSLVFREIHFCFTFGSKLSRQKLYIATASSKCNILLTWKALFYTVFIRYSLLLYFRWRVPPFNSFILQFYELTLKRVISQEEKERRKERKKES